MRVFSIFTSINGEVCLPGIGSQCTFVRFAGCTANCPYCDSTYAADKFSGEIMSMPDIVKKVNGLRNKNVTITGGEPFEQREALNRLIALLANRNYTISVETNGIHKFDTGHPFYAPANFVVDIKNHVEFDSEHFAAMNLRPNDFVKQVVGSLFDFQEAVKRMKILKKKKCKAKFAFSPEYNKVTPKQLGEWMYMDGANVIDAYLNVQLHKVLDLTEAN